MNKEFALILFFYKILIVKSFTCFETKFPFVLGDFNADTSFTSMDYYNGNVINQLINFILFILMVLDCNRRKQL